MVLAGNVVEAICIDLVDRYGTTAVEAAADRLRKRKKKPIPIPNDADKRGFWHLIHICGPDGLDVLGEAAVAIADTVRDWRNLVHPSAAAKKEPVTPARAQAAFAMMTMVIEQVVAKTPTLP